MNSSLLDAVTIRLHHNPIRLISCGSTKPIANPNDNDIFNSRLEHIIPNPDDLLLSDNPSLRSEGHEYPFFFHNDYHPKYGFLMFEPIECHERIFAFMNLYSQMDRTVLLFGIGNKNIKLWLNKELIYNGYFSDSDVFLSLNLKMGNNILFIEYGGNAYQSVSLRLADLNQEFRREYGPLIEGIYRNKTQHCLQLLMDKACFSNGLEYSIMVLPKDFKNITSKKIMVYLYDSGDELVETKQTELYSKLKIDPDSYNTQVFLRLEIQLVDNPVRYHTITQYITVGDISKHLNDLELKIASLVLSEGSREKLNLLSGYEELLALYHSGSCMDANYFKWKWDCLITQLNQYGKGESFLNQLIRTNGAQDIYFRSELDGSVEKYTVKLPNNYNPNAQYPLVIFVAKNRYDPLFHAVISAMNELDQAITVSVSCRGITLGSHIGEVAFMEAFTEIKALLSVDPSRIGLIGYSNGAYAVWSLLQFHPDLFTAGVAIAGVPSKDHLNNVSNLYVLNICGDSDKLVEEAYNTPDKALAGSKGYHGMKIPAINHRDGHSFLYSNWLVSWLLNQRKNSFSYGFSYTTDRERHSRVYFINEFRMSGPKSEVKGVLNDGVFQMEVKHIDQIRLNTEKLKAYCDSIVINNRTINISEEKEQVVDLEWIKSEKQTKTKVNGFDLLDIYMNKLKVVIPKAVGSAVDDQFREIANKFARPKTNGWDPQIYVNYPILSEADFSKELLQEGNLILIQNKQLVSTYGLYYPGLQFDELGFRYGGESFTGDYSLLYIVRNPFYLHNQFILVLYANHPTMYTKNIVTRNVILPSYSNGNTGIFSHQLIVYYDNKYLIE